MAADPKFVGIQLLTLSRIALSVVFAAVVILGEASPTVLIAGLVLLIMAELTDLLDGIAARRSGQASFLGGLLDPYADSVSRLIAVWALVYIGQALALLLLVMILRDITVAYARLLILHSGGSVSARWSGKAKAWIQGIGISLLTVLPLLPAPAGTATVVSWVILIATAVSAVEYVAAIPARVFRGD